MTPIRDRNELTVTLAQPRAFLFLYVNWAIHARQSRSIVTEVMASLAASFPDQPVPCYMADISDGCGELWDALSEWLTAEDQPADHLLLSGVGPLIWVQSGHVILHVLAPLSHGVHELVSASCAAFGLNAA
ncbi:hypothetical protein [Fimbriiglobus ruber]|uniref:hypothetical protein n=1 Tax=Fimbriiglobus ruber TaxID=1908690 RepID=UPI000B4B267A|nr:hypothetical protein [Fimbriiglobus ruber]